VAIELNVKNWHFSASWQSEPYFWPWVKLVVWVVSAGRHIFSIGTVAAYSAKYSALVHTKYWNCSNTEVFPSCLVLLSLKLQRLQRHPRRPADQTSSHAVMACALNNGWSAITITTVLMVPTKWIVVTISCWYSSSLLRCFYEDVRLLLSFSYLLL